ncbi:gamma-glutamyltransferase, partial [candidate division KSB1 bacterium]|nr:gamma-glutamyltransferase [candidate division KSB1 bacterium]
MRQFLIIALFLTTIIRGEESNENQQMVTTAHHLATAAATTVLQHGGNAVDAAIAAMFALPIVEPWASGLGGGGFAIVQMKNDSVPLVLDYREQAPEEANPALLYRDSESFRFYAYTGYRSICVPGMVAGAEFLLNKYGSINLAQILQPVIELARNGFPVSFKFYKKITQYYDLIDMNSATSSIYYPHYLPIGEGEVLTREDLAVLYETIIEKGLTDFYHGSIADKIADDFHLNTALLTRNDLSSYSLKTRKPVNGNYKGYEIISVPPPGYGGAALIELLQILEGFDLKEMHFNSGEYVHVFIEALKHVLNDRETYAADPDFEPVSCENFLTPARAQLVRSKIDTLSASPTRVSPVASKYESENASHVSIVDSEGNCVAFTNTINFYFGSGVTHPRYGILFNNGLFNFSQDSLNINAVEPGKRSVSSMAPTIVMRNDKPLLVLGSSGGARTISTLANIIIAVTVFEMPLQQAIDAPRFFYEDGKVQ